MKGLKRWLAIGLAAVLTFSTLGTDYMVAYAAEETVVEDHNLLVLGEEDSVITEEAPTEGTEEAGLEEGTATEEEDILLEEGEETEEAEDTEALEETAEASKGVKESKEGVTPSADAAPPTSYNENIGTIKVGEETTKDLSNGHVGPFQSVSFGEDGKKSSSDIVSVAFENYDFLGTAYTMKITALSAGTETIYYSYFAWNNFKQTTKKFVITVEPAAPQTWNVSYNLNGVGTVSAPAATTVTRSESGTSYTVEAYSGTKTSDRQEAFLGWNANDGEALIEAGAVTTITGDTVFTPVWDTVYLLSYDLDGGSANVPAAERYSVKDAVKVSVAATDAAKVTSDGHTQKFAGWKDASGVSYEVGASLDLTADLTLIATYENDSYLVSYDVNGGSVVAPETVLYTIGGDEVTVSAYTGIKTLEDGHTQKFVGWDADEDGVVDYEAEDTLTPVSDMTLVAVYETNSYLVSYEIGDGSEEAPAAEVVTIPESGDATAVAAEYEGVNERLGAFLGWATDEEGEIAYEAGDTITVTEDITLYAVYEIVYKVSFVANGGVGDDYTILTSDGTITVPTLEEAGFTRTGFTFVGWAKAPYSTSDITAGDKIDGIEADKTYYAIWEINQSVTPGNIYFKYYSYLNDSESAPGVDYVKFTVDLIDENGNAITTFPEGTSIPDVIAFGASAISVDAFTFSDINVPGYTFDQAYCYFNWAGSGTDTAQGVTAFRNMGRKSDNYSWFNSYIGFICPGMGTGVDYNKSQDDANGYFAYNPTGTLHVVLRKSSAVNVPKTIYMNGSTTLEIVEDTSSYIIANLNGDREYTFKPIDKTGVYTKEMMEEEFTENGRFLGWNTKADGTGTAVDAGFFETAVDSDVYLYAQWNKIHSLSVNAAGGTWEGSAAVQNFDLEETDTKAIADPTPLNGYRFTGWELSAGDSSFAEGTFTMGTDDATLTAQYEEIGYTVEVYYQNRAGFLGTATGDEAYTLDATKTAEHNAATENINSVAITDLDLTAFDKTGFEYKTSDVESLDLTATDGDSDNVIKLYYDFVTYSVTIDPSREGAALTIGSYDDLAAYYNTIGVKYNAADNTLTYNVVDSENFDLPIASAIGASFKGWMQDGNWLVNLFNGTTDTVKAEASNDGKVYVGQWVENKDTVLYVLRPDLTLADLKPEPATGNVVQSQTTSYFTPEVGTAKIKGEIADRYIQFYNGGDSIVGTDNVTNMAYAINGSKYNTKLNGTTLTCQYNGYNYSADITTVKWYVIKSETDHWHVDGIADWVKGDPIQYTVTYKAYFRDAAGNETEATNHKNYLTKTSEKVAYGTDLSSVIAPTFKNIPTEDYLAGWTYDNVTSKNFADITSGKTMPAKNIVVKVVFAPKKVVTLKADSAEYTYNSAAYSVTDFDQATKDALAAEGITVSGLVVNTEEVNAGEYTTVIALAEGTTAYTVTKGDVDVTDEYTIIYEGTGTTGTLLIKPAPLTLVLKDTEKEYDGTAIDTNITYTITAAGVGATTDEIYVDSLGGIQGDDVITLILAGEATHVSESGSKITVSSLTAARGTEDATANYDIETAVEAQSEITITKRPVIVVARDYSRDYNGAYLTDTEIINAKGGLYDIYYGAEGSIDKEKDAIVGGDVASISVDVPYILIGKDDIVVTVNGIGSMMIEPLVVLKEVMMEIVGEDSSDYTVSTVKGVAEITVGDLPISFLANSGNFTYDGLPKLVTGYTTASTSELAASLIESGKVVVSGITASGTGIEVGIYGVGFSGELKLTQDGIDVTDYFQATYKPGRLLIFDGPIPPITPEEPDTPPTPGPTTTIPEEEVPLAGVLGARRGIEADGASVLGARRTNDDAAVLGARRGAATGDTNQLAAYFMAMGAATALGGAYVALSRKKRREDEN